MRIIGDLRIIVAGSRAFNDYDILETTLLDYLKENNDNVTIISGAARGADQLGERFARQHGYNLKCFPAQWDVYGRSAGPIRNKDMAEYAAEECGVLFAFWDGKSRGTKSMIDLAKKYGLEVHVVRYDG